MYCHFFNLAILYGFSGTEFLKRRYDHSIHEPKFIVKVHTDDSLSIKSFPHVVYINMYFLTLKLTLLNT